MSAAAAIAEMFAERNARTDAALQRAFLQIDATTIKREHRTAPLLRRAGEEAFDIVKLMDQLNVKNGSPYRNLIEGAAE